MVLNKQCCKESCHPFWCLVTCLVSSGRYVALRNWLVHGGVCYSPDQVCVESVSDDTLRPAMPRHRGQLVTRTVFVKDCKVYIDDIHRYVF